MKKFEYKVVTIKKGTFTSADKYAELIEAELNALGAEGWELVDVSGNTALEGYNTHFFKRELNR